MTADHDTVIAGIIAPARTIPVDEEELEYIRWYLGIVIAHVERDA